MTVQFDAATGRLRLPRDEFDALATLVRGGDVDNARLAELRSAGAVRGRQPHPVLVPVLGAVAEPVCGLRLELVDDQRRTEQGEGWVAGDAAALLLESPEAGQCELVAVHPMFLPAAIARIVRLGPRPRIPAAEPLQVRPELLDRLTSHHSGVREDAARELPPGATAAALASGLRLDWSVRASWTGLRDSLGGRTLRVLDTVAGLWLVEPGGGAMVVWPTTPTAVWRALVLLLPRDVELSR